MFNHIEVTISFPMLTYASISFDTSRSIHSVVYTILAHLNCTEEYMLCVMIGNGNQFDIIVTNDFSRREMRLMASDQSMIVSQYYFKMTDGFIMKEYA